ncbi:MAG TPA: CHAT domain-containing protein [Thermoanaerobaculia bacterium]|nr:CHAT domain-containing protein [Thermoanaerobaculia bacterium]
MLLIATLAIAAPACAAESPVAVARALYVSFSEGDVEAFKRVWAEGVEPAHLADIAVEQRVKCVTLIAFDAKEPRIDGDHAEVPVVAARAKVSRVTGRLIIDVEHATIGMRREKGEWRVDRWSWKEDDLVDRLGTTKSVDEARALVRENAELLNSTFYRGLRIQSTALINRRQFDALERLTAALRELAALTGDDSARSTALALDSIAERLGPKPDAAKALLTAEEAVTLAERTGNPDVLASGLLNQARAFQWRDGNSMKALPLFERVVADRDHIEDQGLVARAAVQVAVAHEEHGDYRACFPYLEMARDIATRLNIVINLYEVEATFGDIYAFENDFEVAAVHLRRAREYAEKVHFEAAYLSATQMLARCNLRLGRTSDFRAAEDDVIRRATGALKPIASEAYIDIAVDRLQQKDLAAADAAAQEAVRNSEGTQEVDILSRALETMARVRLAQQRYDDAIQTAERAIGLRARQQNVARFTPWLIAAKAHLALGDRAATYAALRSAVDYGEQERAQLAGGERQFELFFEPAAAAYVMLVDLLVEDHQYDEAFLVAEKAKARTLLDILSQERSNAALDIPPADLAEDRRLERALAAANRAAASGPAGSAIAVEKARVDLESHRAVLDAHYPRLQSARGAGDLRSISSLAPLLLNGRRALVEYVVSSDRLHLFIVQQGVRHGTRGPQITVRTVMIEREALTRLVNRFASELASRNAAYKADARELFHILLEPALEAAGSATIVSIVPDDALWRVPFETLVDRSGSFAIETRTYHYAPSTAVLLGEGAHRSANSVDARAHLFLGFGNPRLATPQSARLEPAERGTALAPIPEAEREVKAIAALFGPSGSTVYVGAEALESRAKAEAPEYAIVHFATHGVIDNANPMYSRLLLARRSNDAEDGALEAREMMKLPLRADLVVLSACDTARGDVHAGEGLIGLTWTVFAAGCPSVIASEWRVGSATTEALMESFYRKWLKQRAAGRPFAKAAALRDARLAVLHDPRYRHPYYWSPFVLIGAAD